MNKSKQYKNLESKKNIEVYESKHLPLVKEFAERIGLVETVNKLVPSEMDIDPGTMLLGLILDTLFGGVSNEWGKQICSHCLNLDYTD